MVVHACNPSTGKAEKDELEGQGLLHLHNDFEASLGSMRSYSKQNRSKLPKYWLQKCIPALSPQVFLRGSLCCAAVLLKPAQVFQSTDQTKSSVLLFSSQDQGKQNPKRQKRLHAANSQVSGKHYHPL